MRSYSSPAFAPSGQVVYAGVGGLQGKGQLAALDISHGEPRWKWVVDVAGPVQSSPAATPDGELVIYGSWDSHVYAVRASSGRVATTSELRTQPRRVADGVDGASCGVHVRNE